MLVSLVILVVGAYIIGSYTAGEIKARVIERTSAITALYVDSFVSPHLQELKVGETISPGKGVGKGKDLTLFALVDGQVKYEWKSNDKKKCSVYPAAAT